MGDALIVLDMQVDFCSSGCEQAAAVIMDLVVAARRAGVPVIWVRTEHSDATDTAVWLSRREGSARHVCRPGTPGIEFYRVRPEPGEPVLTKHRYSAFIGTDLGTRLRAMGVTQLICCGVNTNVCVESTVHDAFQRDIAAVTVADACTSSDPGAHEAALRNIRGHFGQVLTSGEVLARWGASAAAKAHP